MSPTVLGVGGVAVAATFAVGAVVGPAPQEGDAAFAFTDPAVVESSGLAVVDGLVVTVNDSGDTGRVFVVDPATGATVGVTRWDADPTDVEAVAPAGDGHVWVADIGDNLGVRGHVEVLRVPVGRGERTVEPEVHRLTYPDGPRDAESLAVDPDGRLLVVSKGFFGGEVYRAPRALGDDVTELTLLDGEDEILPIATDAAMWPDGRHLVVRDYGSAAVYTYPGLRRVGSFPLPDQQQGEGLAVGPDGDLLLSSEGKFAEVLRVPLPDDVRDAMAPAPSSEEPGADPPATADDPATAGADEGPWWPWMLGGAAAGAVLATLLGVLLGANRRRAARP